MSQAGIIILYFFSQYFYLCKMHKSWPTMSVWCVLWYLEEYPQCSQVYFYTDTCLFLMSWSLYRHFERCWWLDSLENNIVDHTLFMHGGKCGYPVAFLWNTTFFSLTPELWKILLSSDYLTCEGLWSNWVAGYLDFKPHIWVTAFEFILKILNPSNLQTGWLLEINIFFFLSFYFCIFKIWCVIYEWTLIATNWQFFIAE